MQNQVFDKELEDGVCEVTVAMRLVVPKHLVSDVKTSLRIHIETYSDKSEDS